MGSRTSVRCGFQPPYAEGIPGLGQKFVARLRLSPDLSEHWNEAAQAACLDDDLEWLLYWVADCADSAEDTKDAADFQKLLYETLNTVGILRSQLERLYRWQYLDESMIRALALYRHHDRAGLLLIFPLLLERFEIRLAELKFPRTVRIRQARAEFREHSEALLLEYVFYFSNKTREDVVAIMAPLMREACEAYGVKGYAFTEEALSRRQRHFRQRHKPTIEFVEKALRDYHSLTNRSRAEFLPFYLTRYIRAGHNNRI